ncbi:MAG: helix-turn-helix domain-containing protein [Pirellulales bacterium]|nr:helix-turn-helix domain-containing protein [Pirellulales bacterium]
MAQKYYNVKEAAGLLGVSEDQVRKMQEQRELYGYRDGADWKFKAEDVERLAAERPPAAPAAHDSSEEVLLSEVALGQSSIGASGTVIGMEANGKKGPDSDLSISADSEIHLAGDSNISVPKLPGDSHASPFEELDLTLEEDVSLEDSSLDLETQIKPIAESPTGGGSSVVTAKPMDDDEMVLGGGSSGSGLTLGGDSGISLVDPHDSGLSLEEPLEIAGSKVESLELGEDDMLSLAGSKKGPGSSVKGDDDFMLTPMEEAGDADESESGSQVIALDTEGDDASTMIASTPVHAMGAMLDEDLGSSPALDFGAGAALGASPLGTSAALAESAAAVPAAAFAPETPYTTPQIIGLVSCTILLMLCGMMMYDMIRNIWSWDRAYTANSSLMDFILQWF